MSTYLEKRGRATAKITAKGFAATLVQPGPIIGPEWDATPGDPVLTLVYVLQIDQDDSDEGRNLKGTVTSNVLIAWSDAAVPAKGDKLIYGGRTRNIDELSPLSPGGVVVLYEAKLTG